MSIPKKGSSLSLDNQRGIAKSCALSKIRNKILFHRIKSVNKSKLLGLQSGFRSGRSTTEQIMTLCSLLNAARKHKRYLTVVFVDYGKAFDSVDRRVIPVMHYGVPDPAVADVMQLYHTHRYPHRSCTELKWHLPQHSARRQSQYFLIC